MDFNEIRDRAELYRADSSYNMAVMTQLIKLQEELGEAAEAYIGAVGQNPRKGITHSYQDLANEIIDVILTGYVALATVVDMPADATEAYFDDRVKYVLSRPTTVLIQPGKISADDAERIKSAMVADVTPTSRLSWPSQDE